MKLLFALAVLLLIAVSLVADYKWKQWMATRRQERDHPPAPGPYPGDWQK